MLPALHGIRVVELTTMITGPMAGMMLADLGAQVVKVEQPGDGDPFRSFNGGSYSPYFCSYNRNKRSIVLDLRSAAGSAAIRKLLAVSDVLLDNFRPEVLDRLGLADDQVRAINPNLIHCSVTGFGRDGPYAARPAYDAVAQALSGMSSMLLDPGDPQILGPTLADNISAHCACQGILAALFDRARGGPARRVEVNMLEATIAFMPDPFSLLTRTGLVSDARSRAHASQSFAFACGDSKLIAVHLSSRDKFWRALTDALDRPALLSDPRFSTRQSRIDNYDELRRAVAPDFLHRPRAKWLRHFADFDLPVAPIYDVSEVVDDPHVRHLGTLFTLQHPVEGRMTAIRRPIRFDGSRQDQPASPPPTLGEHTEEVLRELGLSPPGQETKLP